MEGNMKYTREKIRDVVFDIIREQSKALFIPPIFIPQSVCSEPTEDLDLIGDLEMDSLDIWELVCNSCSVLRIDESKLDTKYQNYGSLETVGDVIDMIWRTRTNQV
jgi:acyl carrier protein